MPSRLRDGRELTVARATDADADAFVRHLEQVAGESDFLSFGRGELALVLEEERAYLKALSEPDGGLALKAVLEGRLVGMVTIVRGHRPRFRHTGTLGLSVQREVWGLGVGRALAEAALGGARELGLRRVTLYVRADNERAIRLYEALGFRLEGRLVGGFAIGDTDYDDLVMGLRWAPATAKGQPTE
jgi:RimJ/RimL family protein N-acetyltransferase